MKKFVCAFVCAMFAAGLSFAVGSAESVTQKSDTSYALGQILGEDLRESGLEINYAALARGLRESIEGTPRFGVDDAINIVQEAFAAADAKQADNLSVQEQEWLAANAKKPGVQTTATGLQYEVIKEGTGRYPTAESVVSVQYEGVLTDDTVFDSSYDRGAPSEFDLVGIIPGFSEGVQLMREGGSARFYVPSSLAYGAQGINQLIPAYSTIIFTVELLEIIE
ncbi:peptidyl-prolyl cis-trans isomerase [Spirochaetia bacterium]|nr:peptidyl-prolyl cis-trans isomerase [Spirochaetia bacterium]GHU32330.1 peptidyl-prolyl cis-trans isomerase [Spirochaetia bacterium]